MLPIENIWLNNAKNIGALSSNVALQKSAGIPSMQLHLPTDKFAIDLSTSSRIIGLLRILAEDPYSYIYTYNCNSVFIIRKSCKVLIPLRWGDTSIYRTNFLYRSDVGPIYLSTSGRHRLSCRSDIGCATRHDVGLMSAAYQKHHIGPMSSHLAFPCRRDIGFLPRSDISGRHSADIVMLARYRMCNTARCRTDVGCLPNNHIGLMSSRFAFPFRPHISF